METKPHAILVPYPAQGHLIPMVELGQNLVRHGIKVTVVNTEYNHHRVMKSLSDEDAAIGEMLEMTTIPDGLEEWEDKKDIAKQLESLMKSIYAGELGALIQRYNAKEGQRVTCLVIDVVLGFYLELPETSGIKKAMYCILAAASLDTISSIPNLLTKGIVDQDGKVLKEEMINDEFPGIKNSTNLMWTVLQSEATSKAAFNLLQKASPVMKLEEWVLVNSCLDLEPEIFSRHPEFCPVGPLLSSNRCGKTLGNFWPENYSCLRWLDQQPPNSVIYVAFGSFAIFDQVQFKELALGLELTNQPFLWVVRGDSTVDVDNSYPEGFKNRTQKQGMIVEWAPQQQVLSHPSVACFISHCGWNSTIESIANGVPILTWPYFGDQFLNESYICDEWKVGLRLKKDGNRITPRGEVKDKVECLLQDKGYKERIKNLQTKSMDSVRKGISKNNLDRFVEWIKNN